MYGLNDNLLLQQSITVTAMSPLYTEWQNKSRFSRDKYLGTGVKTKKSFCPSTTEQIKPKTIF